MINTWLFNPCRKTRKKQHPQSWNKGEWPHWQIRPVTWKRWRKVRGALAAPVGRLVMPPFHKWWKQMEIEMHTQKPFTDDCTAPIHGTEDWAHLHFSCSCLTILLTQIYCKEIAAQIGMHVHVKETPWIGSSENNMHHNFLINPKYVWETWARNAVRRNRFESLQLCFFCWRILHQSQRSSPSRICCTNTYNKLLWRDCSFWQISQVIRAWLSFREGVFLWESQVCLLSTPHANQQTAP